MSELLIFIGKTTNDRDSDPKHGDIIAIQPNGYRWGTEERERAVIMRVPDMTEEEINATLSSEFIVKQADVIANLGVRPPPTEKGVARWRGVSFDFDLLSEEELAIVNDCRDNLSHDNYNLYTKGLSAQVLALSKQTISKEALSKDDIEADEQYYSARSLSLKD